MKDANERRNNNTLIELHHVFPSYSSVDKFIIRRGDESFLEWKHITPDKKCAKIIRCSLPRFSIETLQSPPRNRADPAPLYTSPQCTPPGLVNIHGVTRPLFRGVVLRGKRYGRTPPLPMGIIVFPWHVVVRRKCADREEETAVVRKEGCFGV